MPPTGDTGQLPAIRRDTVEVPSGRYPTVVVRSSHLIAPSGPFLALLTR
jgi:hypothetical protein